MCKCLYSRELRGGTKRDPSLTAKFVNRYEKDLLKMIKEARKEIIELLRGRVVKKEMAEWTIDIKTFRETLSRIINIIFREPATQTGNDVITEQAQRGVMRADQFLAQAGITAYIGGMPIDPNVLDILQERNLTGLMGIADDMERRIIQDVSTGILNGDGAAEIGRSIEESIGVSESQAMRIARTETMTAFNQASTDRYKQFGIDEVVWRTGGSNICTYVKGFDGVVYNGGCMGLNGEIFGIDAAPPVPLHPNCKCILQPVIERVGK